MNMNTDTKSKMPSKAPRLSRIAACRRRAWINANTSPDQAAMLNKIIAVGGPSYAGLGEGWFHEVTAPFSTESELATLRSLEKEELVTLHKVSPVFLPAGAETIIWITLCD
jgi:hypothetical protein